MEKTILEMTNENGEKLNAVILGTVEMDSKRYCIFSPEGYDEKKDIFVMEEHEKENNSEYTLVTDLELVYSIINTYNESNNESELI